MAIKHNTFTTSTTVQTLYTAPLSGKQTTNLKVRNNDSVIAVTVGDSTLSTSGRTIGMTIGAGVTMDFHIEPGTSLYVVAASGAPTVTTLAN